MNDRKLVIAAVLTVLAIAVLTSPRWSRKPAPVPAPVTQCWGLEQWHVEGDSVILLKFHKMPDTVEIQAKGETK